jgi:hypothetical protein
LTWYLLWISRSCSIITIFQQFLPDLCPFLVLWICYFFCFRMITCEWKVRLKLGVVCKCFLGVSRSSLKMTIFRQFLPELCHFLYFGFQMIGLGLWCLMPLSTIFQLYWCLGVVCKCEYLVGSLIITIFQQFYQSLVVLQIWKKFGFWIITCDWKVRCVVCKCILWISR